MAKKIWKQLDEFYGANQTPAGTGAEFDSEVEQAMAAIRREYGIHDDGTVAESAGERSHQSPADAAKHAEDLRKLLPDVSRRGFMRLSGAAAVFGMAGCWHNPPETLVPYAQQPEGAFLSRPLYYNSVVRTGGQAHSVLVKRYDGRPIKLEGNPDDVTTGGKLGAKGQAAILDLYDPDRSSHGPQVRKDGELIDGAWDEIDFKVGESLKSGGVALVTGPWNGPSRMQLSADLKAAFWRSFPPCCLSPICGRPGTRCSRG